LIVKALTIWQPWASLIGQAIKSVENRSWEAPWVLGKRIAIHAGNKFDESAALHLSVCAAPVPAVVHLARKVKGAIVCTAVVDRFIGRAEADNVESDIFVWFSGPVGWVLRDVQKFDPVPCRGAQGLWDVPADALARIPEHAR